MPSRAATEHRYAKLTWPEINDAIEMQKVCIVPCGSVEQHGPHLPLDVDIICPTEIAMEAGRRAADRILVLPTVSYGYTGHVMDFPGTINSHWTHFIDQVLDITKSLAYHGFKKLVLLNGHGSNMPNLDLVSRRTNLETDAECVLAAWWQLLQVDPGFMKAWREGPFPGSCSHACELETSVYLYLDGENVRKDQIRDEIAAFNVEKNPFIWGDLMAKGPVAHISWTSGYTGSGVTGTPELATAEKGQQAFEEAVTRLVEFVSYYRQRPVEPRRDHHRTPPTIPMPWGQTPVPEA
jgi:creatinine amidohydrolase